MKQYLSVCASSDDLALIRTVAHSTEHSVGKDDLTSYKPPAKGNELSVIVGGAAWVDGHLGTHVRSQMMQVPALLAVTHCMQGTIYNNTHTPLRQAHLPLLHLLVIAPNLDAGDGSLVLL